MDRRQGFSLLLVPRGTDERQVREIRLSGTALAGMGVGVLAAAILFVAMAATYGSVLVDQVRYTRLQRDNQVLQSQLAEMGQTVQGLTDQMAVIAQRDDVVRLAAELDPLSEDLRRAGIGGSYRDFDRRVLLASGPSAGQVKTLQATLSRLSREAKLESESLLEVKASLDESETFLKGYPSIFPIDWTKYRTRISSPFGNRTDPIYGTPRFHEGNDIVVAFGTPVRATADGYVEAYDNTVTGFRKIGLGNYVKMNHGNGYETAYGHMSRLAPRIRKGVRIKRGEVIGYVGNTGRSQGTHLHYEVMYQGKPINPWLHYFTDRVADVTGVKDLPTYPDGPGGLEH